MQSAGRNTDTKNMSIARTIVTIDLAFLIMNIPFLVIQTVLQNMAIVHKGFLYSIIQLIYSFTSAFSLCYNAFAILIYLRNSKFRQNFFSIMCNEVRR